ncbi:MAG: hypothetical protein HRU38_08660 [Saccharospirillaceae bacterium]|nr:hypothetical protein [Pseudomonadales bacterium]NRB78724.1 hypothetical protein [Saccharospirillaceae bacterium]
MSDQKETRKSKQAYWIFGLLLFIPINLFVGAGLLFSGDAVIRDIKYDKFDLFNDAMIIGFFVNVIFMIFNLSYIIYSLRNLEKYKGIWYLTLPILFSFIEFVGCIPVLASINLH